MRSARRHQQERIDHYGNCHCLLCPVSHSSCRLHARSALVKNKKHYSTFVLSTLQQSEFDVTQANSALSLSMNMLKVQACLLLLMTADYFKYHHCIQPAIPTCPSGTAPNSFQQDVITIKDNDQYYYEHEPNEPASKCPYLTFVCQIIFYEDSNGYLCAASIVCCDFKNNIINSSMALISADPDNVWSCSQKKFSTTSLPYPGIFYILWDWYKGIELYNPSETLLFSWAGTQETSQLPSFGYGYDMSTYCPGPTGGVSTSYTTYFMSGFNSNEGSYALEIFPLCNQMCPSCPTGTYSSSGTACSNCVVTFFVWCSFQKSFQKLTLLEIIRKYGPILNTCLIVLHSFT